MTSKSRKQFWKSKSKESIKQAKIKLDGTNTFKGNSLDFNLKIRCGMA